MTKPQTVSKLQSEEESVPTETEYDIDYCQNDHTGVHCWDVSGPTDVPEAEVQGYCCRCGTNCDGVADAQREAARRLALFRRTSR